MDHCLGAIALDLFGGKHTQEGCRFSQQTSCKSMSPVQHNHGLAPLMCVPYYLQDMLLGPFFSFVLLGPVQPAFLCTAGTEPCASKRNEILKRKLSAPKRPICASSIKIIRNHTCTYNICACRDKISCFPATAGRQLCATKQ